MTYFEAPECAGTRERPKLGTGQGWQHEDKDRFALVTVAQRRDMEPVLAISMVHQKDE